MLFVAHSYLSPNGMTKLQVLASYFCLLLFREICYDISAFCFEAGHFIEDGWYF